VEVVETVKFSGSISHLYRLNLLEAKTNSKVYEEEFEVEATKNSTAFISENGGCKSR